MTLRRKMFAGIALFGCLLGCQSAQASPPDGSDPGATSRSNEVEVLKYLRPALAKGYSSARLYYRAPSCQMNGSFPVPFPQTSVQPMAAGLSGLAAVQSVFRGDGNTKVTDEPQGTVEIRIGDVPDSILHTRISRLALTPLEQYNPEDAIGAVLSNRDVDKARRRLGFHTPSEIDDHLVNPPQKTAPHLPHLMRNVTVDQVLNMIARKFKGIVLYGACSQSLIFDIGFASIEDFAATLPNGAGDPHQ